MAKTRWIVVGMVLGHVALAQEPEQGGEGGATQGIDIQTPLQGIPDTLCNGANFLYGPIGGAVVLIFLVWGFIQWKSNASGQGVGKMVYSIAGGFLLVALPTLVSGFGFDCTLTLGAGGGEGGQ